MLKRHLSTEECLFKPMMSLCGSSIAPFLLFKEQSCDDHEVIREHCGSDQQFEPLAPFGKAS